MQQARPWTQPARVECLLCGATARWLVYLPEPQEDGKWRDTEDAFAGTLETTPALSCEKHYAQMMADLILIASHVGGVAAAPLRATWRGWFHDSTYVGRLVWDFHLWRCARIVEAAA